MTDKELDKLEAEMKSGETGDYFGVKRRDQILVLIARVRELQAATSAYRLPPEPGYTETALEPPPVRIPMEAIPPEPIPKRFTQRRTFDG